jgi:hypothetical protein
VPRAAAATVAERPFETPKPQRPPGATGRLGAPDVTVEKLYENLTTWAWPAADGRLLGTERAGQILVFK